MKLTIAEAKTKLCCVEGCGRYNTPSGEPAMQHAPTDSISRYEMVAAEIIPGQRLYCAGADCMGWRWLLEPQRKRLDLTMGGEPQYNDKEPLGRPDNVPADWTFVPGDANDDTAACYEEPQTSAEARRAGYCGRAGRP